MAIIDVDGEWYTVAVNGEILGWFGHSLDAHRFALGMLHDGMVDTVQTLKRSFVAN